MASKFADLRNKRHPIGHNCPVPPLPLLHLLSTALGHVPELTLRHGVPFRGLAEVDFVTGVITLQPNLDPGELHVALAHELVHVLRGPAESGAEAAEEHLVHSAVAQLLAPRHLLPVILHGANPTEIAERLVLDRHTARLALDLARAEDATGAA